MLLRRSYGYLQTTRVMERIEPVLDIEPVLEAERPELIIVPGDANSTLVRPHLASKRGIPGAHRAPIDGPLPKDVVARLGEPGPHSSSLHDNRHHHTITAHR
jgi:hypothetical protein